MVVIGVTGTFGAGKSTVAKYLVSQKGFTHFSGRAFLAEELEHRGLVAGRDELVTLSDELTKKHGPAYIAEMLYKRAVSEKRNAVIESIRRPAEAEFLKKQNPFFLVAVDAESRIRYARIAERKSGTDLISFEDFLAHEKREMNARESHTHDIQATIDIADFTFNNNGTKEEFEQWIESMLSKILTTQV